MGREMVVFLFADVVSARDMRDFLQPNSEGMRIGQWALRAEHFWCRTHLRVPVGAEAPLFDEIGEPGDDFFVFPWLPAGNGAGRGSSGKDLDGSNWGARVSRTPSMVGSAPSIAAADVSPTLYALNQGWPACDTTGSGQFGTFSSKDLAASVLKGEAVHTHGRSLNTFSSGPGLSIGLLPTDMVDYALGVDVPAGDWRFNAQYYGRWLEEACSGLDGRSARAGRHLQVMARART